MTSKRKCKLGDLITVGLDRKFPLVLREGPGYTFVRVETIDPGDVGIVLEEKFGHGSLTWIMIHVAEKQKMGWIPESMIHHVDD